jgi:hypothetical protein
MTAYKGKPAGSRSESVHWTWFLVKLGMITLGTSATSIGDMTNSWNWALSDYTSFPHSLTHTPPFLLISARWSCGSIQANENSPPIHSTHLIRTPCIYVQNVHTMCEYDLQKRTFGLRPWFSWDWSHHLASSVCYGYVAVIVTEGNGKYYCQHDSMVMFSTQTRRA